jgi:hypothetical protein
MAGNMQKARKQCSSLTFLHHARKRVLGKAVFISRIIVIQKMDLQVQNTWIMETKQ